MEIPNMCLLFGKHCYAFSCRMLLCILAQAIVAAGVHANFGPFWWACQVDRADYPAFCASVDSRVATDADLQASYNAGHDCCRCGYTNEGIRYLVQDRTCNGRTSPGIYTCTGGGCRTKSNTYCTHDRGKWNVFNYFGPISLTLISRVVLFHNNISPSFEQPEHRKLAHEL